MEQKFSNLGVMEAVNHSKNSAVEADTTSKHRRSITSQKGRGNLLRKICFALLAVCIVFVRCDEKDDDDSNGNGNSKGDAVYLLETISWNGKLSERFEYDNQNRIKKINYFNNDGSTIYGTLTITYNSSGDITSYKRQFDNYPDDNYEFTVTKDGNKVLLTDEGYVITIDLNAQGLPAKLVSRWSNSDFYYTRNFQYQKGNISQETSIETWENGSSTSTATFTYDDKKSPFYHCKTPKWFFFDNMFWSFGLENNITKITYSENGTSTGSNNFENFAYNAAGFPIKRTFVEEEGIDEFTYIIK